MEGSSDNVCAETYTGPSAFSEPEVKALADYISANEGYIKMFLSFHSYSQLLLYPFSYTNAPSEDEELLHELCEITAIAIEGVHGTQYVTHASNALCKYRNSLILLNVISCEPSLPDPHHGTSVDWTYGAQGITISVTFEFRDTGAYGFVLPADQIIPNAEETRAGVIALVQEAGARNLI